MTVALGVAVACALLAYAVFAVQSVVLAVIDARTHRLPDRYVLPGYPVAAVLLTASALAQGAPQRLLPVAGGALALFAFYLLLRMLRPAAMGGGDVKLAGVIGAYLGFLGWESVLVGALAGFLLAGIYAVVLLLTRRAAARTAIPFGPWMLGGAWFAILAAALPALASR
ncbi:prepilin peptidase [Microbacterium lushaniae]|uniref:Prepilin peptidase n=1 Tax=Microbacterium lushaniae TaxID=2614639 RepID=A0A5J6L2T7_9MICO|nr:A24 family peptidase [Microbacterium lushaniae]QEW02800.1 prepilin peptidase [Microbacterium lushaniae]